MKRWIGVVCALVVLAACAGAEPLRLREPVADPVANPSPDGGAEDRGDGGRGGPLVRVAYPEEPAVWLPALLDEPAAVDLSALWGLPLYAYDTHGQLRPRLAEGFEIVGDVEGGWAVDVRLRSGDWSDGQPVVAGDVVATLAALRAGPRSAELGPLASVEAMSQEVVRLTFDTPYGRWPHLLAGAGGVLPAHVLGERGLDAYRQGVPEAGGWYRLEAHEPGLRATFVAHHGPLGAPAVERVEVLFVPDVETALGLLDDGEVEAVLGYLALGGQERVDRVEGALGGAPPGGTTVALRWRPGGAFGGFEPAATERRRQVRDALDLGEQVEGLFGDAGALATSLVPGVEGPWASGRGGPPLSRLPSPTVLVPKWQEAPAFSIRAIQQQVRNRGADVEIVRLEPDALARSAAGDAVLEIRRDGPWPSMLQTLVTGAPEALVAAARGADTAPTRDAPAVRDAQQALSEDGHVLPLYRIAVTHAWRPDLEGFVPSSWPGLAFWDVGHWHLREG